ncbi:cell surface protein [Halobacteriales archaeon QS_1_68_17]|nr:MAG: cell surface protein [Halobacteriales archaeon QS_1_68_17]
MDHSRRGFLRVAGLGAAAGFGGCTGRPGDIAGRESGGDVGESPATTASTQFRGGLRRRGVYPQATVPASVTVDWTVPDVNTGEHTAAKASPVRAPGGDVVVPGDTGQVRRVTPDGEVRWVADTDHSTRGIHGTPAIANGAVYVGAYDGALYAFDIESGERRWRADLADAIGSSPAYHDGTVYIAVEYYDPSGAMYGVDAGTGEVVWDDQRPTDHPHSTCAVDRAAGRLVVGANDGTLYAWRYPDRSFAWTFDTGRAIKGPVATYDGSAFFGSWDGNVYRVALDDGSKEWAFETDGLVMSGPSVEPSTGRVYVGSHDSYLYALDAATGERQWSFDTGGTVLGCPTVTRDHVLVGSYDRHLYALDKETGAGVWNVSADGWVTSTPLVTDDAVYFTARASEAYLEDGDGPTGPLYRLVPDG